MKINALLLVIPVLVIAILSFTIIFLVAELDHSVSREKYDQLMVQKEGLVNDYNILQQEHNDLAVNYNELLKNSEELISIVKKTQNAYDELFEKHDSLINDYNKLFDINEEVMLVTKQTQNAYDELFEKHDSLINDYNLLVETINKYQNDPNLFDILIQFLPLLI